jgi:hypothetical protein
MRVFILIAALVLSSCASKKVIHQEDITHKAQWLESSEDNPIINVIQKHYANNDVEVIIKKKLTTDYVKLRLSKQGRTISKTTIKNQ